MSQVAVVHADESCLGNGREGMNPGGAGILIEIRIKDRLERFDLFLASPDTTNNRMALSGAIATFALLSRKERRLSVGFVSDSEYLVKGMREWVPGWRARGWKRKGGEIENLELWQALVKVAEAHDAWWLWVRGHAGDPKNEYADWLAVRAAREQITSEAAVPSEFLAWLEGRRARGRFTDYDPDAAFAAVAAEVVR
jgi:ribonuclease HI